MYEVLELESNLPADIADTLNTEEEAGWSLVSLTADVAGRPTYCILHKLPTAPQPPEGTGVTAR